MIRISDWSIIYHTYNIYTAPELMAVHLSGNAVNHPKLGNSRIVSSPIVKVEGRIVYTETGSIYKLGKIDPKYRQWIRKNYANWYWKHPIKIKEL